MYFNIPFASGSSVSGFALALESATVHALSSDGFTFSASIQNNVNVTIANALANASCSLVPMRITLDSPMSAASIRASDTVALARTRFASSALGAPSDEFLMRESTSSSHREETREQRPYGCSHRGSTFVVIRFTRARRRRRCRRRRRRRLSLIKLILIQTATTHLYDAVDSSHHPGGPASSV
jgi:hypothetical protein